MKKLITAVFLIFTITSFSQDLQTGEQTVYKRDIAKNELSIGALNLVAFGALDITYERIVTPNTSWAIEGFVMALNRSSEDLSDAYNKDFSLTGKFKYFFGDRTAWGFYVSGLSMISTGEYETSTSYTAPDGYYEYEYETNNYTDLALGFGLGGKFVAKQGFFVDLSTGIGRNLFNSNSPTIIGQFNANLGFRF